MKVKGKPTILTYDSPLMTPNFAELALRSFSRNGQYLTLQDIYYEILEGTAKKESGLAPENRTVNVLEAKPCESGAISLTREMGDSRFILKNNTEEFFKRMNNKPVKFVDLPDVALDNTAIVNYTGVNSLADEVVFDCSVDPLSYYPSIGIRSHAESVLQNALNINQLTSKKLKASKKLIGELEVLTLRYSEAIRNNLKFL